MKSSSPPDPEPIDPGESMGEYLFGKRFSTDYEGVTDPRLQEKLIAAEKKYRPEYTALELADIQTMAKGTDDTPGLISLLGDYSAEAGKLQREQLQEQRAADVAAIEEYSPRVVEAYRTADPYSTGLADLQRQQAETLYAEAEGQLSPERRRMAEQAARQASVARGRIGDQSAIAGELLGRERVRSGLRAEARQAGQLGFGMSRALAGDIGSTLLGRPSQSIGLGSGLLGQAQAGAAQPVGPQLFDPNVGLNMALQEQSNMAQYQGAVAQSRATRDAGLMGLGGSLLGAAGAAGGFGKLF